MIVWGIKAKLLRAWAIVFECLQCQKSEHTAYLFQRYFHLFWIPTIPLNRVVTVQCQNCKAVLEEKQLVGATVDLVKREKSNGKAPVWMFAGLVLIACALGYGVWNEKHEDEVTAQAIAAPAAEDAAVLPVGPLLLPGLSPEDKFTVIRILDIDNEKIHYIVASRVFKSASDAKKHFSIHGHELTYFADFQGTMSLKDYRAAGVYFVKRGK